MDDSGITGEKCEVNKFMMKHSLLLGVDRLLMARKPGSSFDFEPQEDNSEAINTQPNFPLFPLNSTAAYLTLLLLKLAGFQISLLLTFLTLPIRFLNFSFMFLMFPFQMLTHLRDQIKKAFHISYFKLFNFVCNRLSSHKSVLKVAARFGRAVFCAAYMFFMLVGLLFLGFAIGGIITKKLVRESIHTTEALNFDYTKTSPVAVVPVSSYEGVLPYKLKLTVSLTLPESEYNRKLGIFQVRVETLSDNGKVIRCFSYPTMLRFKSKPVRAFETLFNSAHLVAGLKSEVQHLKIGLGEFINERYETTVGFKVILEQRAEILGGSGLPEIYGGLLKIESELPKLKRVLWDWRWTVFVWISLGTFVAELMVVLIFFRGVVLPAVGGERSKAVDQGRKKCWLDKITWHKPI